MVVERPRSATTEPLESGNRPAPKPMTKSLHRAIQRLRLHDRRHHSVGPVVGVALGVGHSAAGSIGETKRKMSNPRCVAILARVKRNPCMRSGVNP